MVLYYCLMTKVDRSLVIVRYFPGRVVTTGFQHLTVLQLSNNDLNGSLPRIIFRLPRLRVLYVSSNSDLAGSLPGLPAGNNLEEKIKF
jgi:hypothetical protein